MAFLQYGISLTSYPLLPHLRRPPRAAPDVLVSRARVPCAASALLAAGVPGAAPAALHRRARRRPTARLWPPLLPALPPRLRPSGSVMKPSPPPRSWRTRPPPCTPPTPSAARSFSGGRPPQIRRRRPGPRPHRRQHSRERARAGRRAGSAGCCSPGTSLRR